jgi:hypothetical protein
VSDEHDTFHGLKFLIQYRRNDDGVRWHNMAAFDVAGAAERFFAKQKENNDIEDWPWEYRLVDLSTEPQP